MVLSRAPTASPPRTPLAALTDGRDALLAVGMNGEPLPFEHGFPVRMVVPGLYGYVSATKWVVDLEVTRFDRDEAYWTARGWAEQAPIKTSSRIDVPRPFAQRPAGRGRRRRASRGPSAGDQQVEVRVDGGAWQDARLAASLQRGHLAPVGLEWDATPGTHTPRGAGPTDGTGDAQTRHARPPNPTGPPAGTPSSSGRLNHDQRSSTQHVTHPTTVPKRITA